MTVRFEDRAQLTRPLRHRGVGLTWRATSSAAGVNNVVAARSTLTTVGGGCRGNMARVDIAGSPSIERPDYWWYRARADLLRAALQQYVGKPARLLDVGSADGPSVRWLSERGNRVALDIDPRGLAPGDVCGSAIDLPFVDAAFDVVAAFDVLEHCEPEARALAEMTRVLTPGGRLLMSVPAYQWAWSRFDELNHHHRRYTRRRVVASVETSGLEVLRASYMFTGTFPFFAAERLYAKFRERGARERLPVPGGVPRLPRTGPAVERVLMAATRIDSRLLPRWDLPFGSSVVVVARKPTDPASKERTP
jgi:SAM-dependent methyltransferase